MKRALIYASVASMIQQFNMDNIQLLLELGYEVDVACNMEKGSTITAETIAAMKEQLETMNVRVIHIPVPRKTTAIGEMVQAFRHTRALLNQRKYDLIHCHSPIGGFICRIANRICKYYRNTKMIYTAHGFHFYKGAPCINWLVFYPMEKLCSRYTDVLITINQEDFLLAEKKLWAKKVQYVPGVGIQTNCFANTTVNASDKKAEIGILEQDFMIFSVGELNFNKNHEVVIRAMEHLPEDIHYVIAGKGELHRYLTDLAKELGVEDRLHLLGFRSDVAQLLKVTDLFIFPSFREGLPVSVMEAMAAGNAVVCSKIRGNVDLIEENIGGFLVDAEDINGFNDSIQALYHDRAKMESYGMFNAQRAIQYDIKIIRQYMEAIYSF